MAAWIALLIVEAFIAATGLLAWGLGATYEARHGKEHDRR